MTTLAYVGLGSNLAHPRRRIARALRSLARLPATRVVRVSANYASAPLGAPDAQPDYVNAVAALCTALSPRALLAHLMVIERRHGRRRTRATTRNAARTLDLDLLIYGGRRLRSATLTVPHPRLHERAFVVRPLVDIAPAVRIPGKGPARALRRAVRGQRIAPTRRHYLPKPMELDKRRYVVVEGPIGAGKTSLARELAERLHAEVLLEQPEDNPFLSRFYDDMPRFALPTQLTFLFQRVDQLRGLAQLDLFRRPTVADFLLDKDPLFARLNLTDDEYALYDKVYRHLKPQTPTPDLVIYLQAPVDTLIERVLRRGVAFERQIPEAYLARLADAYTRFFYQYTDAPLLIVNSERLNFVDDPGHVDLLLDRIRAMRGPREFFNLGTTA